MDGEAGLQEQYLQCVLDEEELADPAATTTSHDAFTQAQDLFEQTLVPEGEDEWEVSGRYDPIHNGTLNLHNHQIPGGAEAYLTSKQYTETDVSRWLHNSYEGTLLRRAVHYETLKPKEQIKIGKIWMRRFTNARRKDAQYQVLRVSGAHVKPGDVYHDGLVRRLEQMVILNYSRDRKYQCDKPYTLDEVSDFKKTYRLHVTDVRWTMVDDLCHELQNRELARQTKLHALGVEGLKAELRRRADEIGQRLLSGNFEEWTPCFREEDTDRISWKIDDQERWVVTMFAALQYMEEIQRTPHADKAIDYLGDLAVCASRSWKMAAISDTSMGDALMAHFAHFEDPDSCVNPSALAAIRQRFARFFEVYPAEVLFDAKCMDRALRTTTTARNPDIDRNWLAKRRTEIVLETARRANGLPDYSPINIYTLRITPCHVLSTN